MQSLCAKQGRSRAKRSRKVNYHSIKHCEWAIFMSGPARNINIPGFWLHECVALMNCTFGTGRNRYNNGLTATDKCPCEFCCK